MKNVCVITGGGSGMGLAAAEYMPKDKIIVIVGRTVSKLQNAADLLKDEGHEVYVHACDTSSRESVRELAEFAASLGTVKNVINAAGVSPAMADPESLVRINALGTVYMNEEFAKVMDRGSVIVDVSSNSAYAIPSILRSLARFNTVFEDEEKFVRNMLRFTKLAGDDYVKKGLAYALSKNFVCWYAEQCAFLLGEKGIRVVSLSPGLVSTGMGNLEKEEGKEMIDRSAEGRMGRPAELGYALATLADERNGYLSGVDVLVDGGSTSGKHKPNPIYMAKFA